MTAYQIHPIMKPDYFGIEELVWERLSLIPDPEVPVSSILEFGVVREVRYNGESLVITITPTYTGCPAMNLFVAEIKAAMHEQGFSNIIINTVYHSIKQHGHDLINFG